MNHQVSVEGVTGDHGAAHWGRRYRHSESFASGYVEKVALPCIQSVPLFHLLKKLLIIVGRNVQFSFKIMTLSISGRRYFSKEGYNFSSLCMKVQLFPNCF